VTFMANQNISSCQNGDSTCHGQEPIPLFCPVNVAEPLRSVQKSQDIWKDFINFNK
jgi:hypothetical protein